MRRIVFMDTEFTDFNNTHLISVGMTVERSDESFYAEINDFPKHLQSGFVTQHIIPMLDLPQYGMPLAELKQAVSTWIQSLNADEILIVVDYTGDWILMHPHFADIPNVRVRCSLLDPAVYDVSVERGISFTPSWYHRTYMQVAEDYWSNVDQRQHHALVDARAAKAGWEAVFKESYE